MHRSWFDKLTTNGQDNLSSQQALERWMKKTLDSSLRSEYLMRVATLTTWNENMCGAETGDHKEPVS